MTLIGSEPTLPYERPPLSKAGAGAVKPIRPIEAYATAGIDLRLGVSVARIDRVAQAVALSDGASLAYDRLLLATGAKPRVFPGFEACVTLRNDLDAAGILSHLTPGARIGIIGGGFIGLELAATARRCGARVTLFEAAPRLMARAVPEQIAQVFEARHRAEGVDLRLSANVAAGDATSVTLTDGTTLRFDLVVAGMGATPQVDLAIGGGLDVANGITVDGHLCTSDPHIFAAGDCCNFDWRGARVRLESWKAAQDQGAHAAAAMLGATEHYGKAPWFWSDQYHLALQVAGLFDMGQPVQIRETQDNRVIVFQCDAQGQLLAAAGVGIGNAIAKDIRIFEKLIERGSHVDPALLGDPEHNLKRFLKAA